MIKTRKRLSGYIFKLKKDSFFLKQYLGYWIHKRGSKDKLFKIHRICC